MRTHVATYVWGLGVFSLLAVAVGILTIVTAFTTTYGSVARMTGVVSESLDDLERTVGVLNEHRSEFRSLLDVPPRIEATMRDLPGLVETSSEVLAATATTLDKTATLVEAMDGRGDFVMEGSPLKELAVVLRENSEKLRAIRAKMTETRATLETTVAESTRALRAAATIAADLRETAPRLDELENRLHDMRAASERGMFAAGAAGMQAMIGGLYLLIGLLLAALATLWSQLERRRLHDR